MKKNIFDEIFDDVYNLLDEVTRDEEKGGKVQPTRYGQEMPTEREQLYRYFKLGDEEKMMYAQSFGRAWNQYEQKMQQLRSKYHA